VQVPDRVAATPAKSSSGGVVAARIVPPLQQLATAVPFDGRDAIACLPAIVLLASVGMAVGHPIEGVTAASAAFMVGFGVDRCYREWCRVPVIAAVAATTAAALAGSVMGEWRPGFVLASAGAAGVVGWMSARDETLWWIGLQCALAFIIAGAFASTLSGAVVRAMLIATGGITQVAVTWYVRRTYAASPGTGVGAPPQKVMTTATRIEHATLTALAVGMATVVADRLRLTNGYWAPMTTLLILKPGLRDTQTRGVARVAGTVGGCVGASLLALIIPPGHFVLVPALATATWLSFALKRAHYALFTAAVTATVVVLLAIARVPELVTARHRITATVIGGVIGLVVAYARSGLRMHLRRPSVGT
jgi:hypothetical protein